VGCSTQSIYRLLIGDRGPKRRVLPRAALRLSGVEREDISRGIGAAESCRMIAARLGRAPSTVARDIVSNGGRRRYRAWRAEAQAVQRAQRPKVAKLVRCPALRQAIEQGLTARWSPQQIAARLVVDYPDDLQMRVSHETIYQSLFVQTRGALRRELVRCLRTGRAHRQPRRRTPSRQGRMPDMVMIKDRSPEVADRAVPGAVSGGHRDSPSNTSEGVSQPRVHRGRSLNSAASASRWAAEWVKRYRPFGMYWRSIPFTFSLEPPCHGLCGSEKYTCTPVSIENCTCSATSFPRSQVTARRSYARGGLRSSHR
jgi:Helix-turn-helix domain